VAWQLQRAIPTRRFELDILAFLGDSLEKQHLKLSAITKRPDAVIIYSGHNEFTARFEENRDYSLAEEPRLRLLQSAYRVSLHSPFCRLVYELVSKNRLDSPPLMNGRHQLIDPPLCSPSETAEVLADFTARLEALVGYCERIGALPILIIPPANEADYEPSRSTLPPTVSRTERDRLAREFQEVRGVEATDPALGQSLYRGILDRHPDFAEAHFRLGRLLERAGLIDEARRHFSEALENDGLPNRCKLAFREAYHKIATRHPDCILIDGRKELMAASPTGLLDDHLIEDTHHPNVKGQVVLACAVLKELRDKKTFGASPRFALPLDPLECFDRFQMDAARLATACDRTSVHYGRVSGYRYDPTERLEKSRRFAEAARKLRAGTTPREVGLPGLDWWKISPRPSDTPLPLDASGQ
jgi:tetratricopeptide (TPR) repeat protein